jgi:hypothetical protein
LDSLIRIRLWKDDMNQRVPFLMLSGAIVVSGVVAGSWLLTRTTRLDEAAGVNPPSAVKPTSRPRTASDIRADISRINAQLDAVDGKKIITAAGRSTVDKETVRSLLQEMLALGHELAQVDPKSDSVDEALFALMILGDADAATAVNVDVAAGGDAAFRAQTVRAMADYVLNESNADRQILAIDQFFEALKASGNDSKLAARVTLLAKATPASTAVRDHLTRQISESIPEPRKTTVLDRLRKTAAAAMPS